MRIISEVLGMGDWVQDFFIKKAHLFLKVMNERWKIAEEESIAIANLLAKHGVSEGKVLDLMCGNGRIATNLAKLGYNVVGIDISPIYIQDAIKKAQEHNVQDKVTFVAGDVRELDKFVSEQGPFDAVINVWTSIGFYDEKTDEQIFRKAAELSREGAVLLILSAASRDLIINRFSPKTFEEFEDMVILHINEFNPYTSTLKTRWKFYKKENKDLKYIDEVQLNLRLYSIHELIKILNNAGWEFVEAYKSIIRGEPFEVTGPLNIIAKRKKF